MFISGVSMYVSWLGACVSISACWYGEGMVVFVNEWEYGEFKCVNE